jgi:hypothetical protein
MKALISALILLGVTARGLVASPGVLPAELRHVLELAKSAELYSLEPLSTHESAPKFQGYEILGETPLNAADTRIATEAFSKAVEAGNGNMPNCFDPRHALRIVLDGHRYDFLLCYACAQLTVYKDDKEFTDLSAAGSPKVLNDLLQAHHVPISHSGDKA